MSTRMSLCTFPGKTIYKALFGQLQRKLAHCVVLDKYYRMNLSCISIRLLFARAWNTPDTYDLVVVLFIYRSLTKDKG